MRYGERPPRDRNAPLRLLPEEKLLEQTLDHILSASEDHQTTVRSLLLAACALNRLNGSDENGIHAILYNLKPYIGPVVDILTQPAEEGEQP